MGITSRKAVFHCSLFFLVLHMWVCGSNAVHGFEIFRGKHDIFTNLICYDESELKCTDEQCNFYDAHCAGENNCKYCVCSRENKNTFIAAGDSSEVDGVCKSGDDILPGT